MERPSRRGGTELLGAKHRAHQGRAGDVHTLSFERNREAGMIPPAHRGVHLSNLPLMHASLESRAYCRSVGYKSSTTEPLNPITTKKINSESDAEPATTTAPTGEGRTLPIGPMMKRRRGLANADKRGNDVRFAATCQA